MPAEPQAKLVGYLFSCWTPKVVVSESPSVTLAISNYLWDHHIHSHRSHDLLIVIHLPIQLVDPDTAISTREQGSPQVQNQIA